MNMKTVVVIILIGIIVCLVMVGIAISRDSKNQGRLHRFFYRDRNKFDER